jgi:hypothetical protein
VFGDNARGVDETHRLTGRSNGQDNEAANGLGEQVRLALS